MTLLTIINDAQSVLNLPQSTTVIGNTGQTQKQLLALANMEGRLTSAEFPWQVLTRETSFTTTATEEQTHASADLPADLSYIVNETIYNRNTTLKITGPLNSRDWQERKAFGANVAWSQFRIRGNSFWFLPAPTASETCYYEYVSNYWCESSGGTAQARWAADTDLFRLPEVLMTLGVIWRWKASKGLNYEEDHDTWEIEKQRAQSRDGTKRKLRLDGPMAAVRSNRGTIPEGSW